MNKSQLGNMLKRGDDYSPYEVEEMMERLWAEYVETNRNQSKVRLGADLALHCAVAAETSPERLPRHLKARLGLLGTPAGMRQRLRAWSKPSGEARAIASAVC